VWESEKRVGSEIPALFNDKFSISPCDNTPYFIVTLTCNCFNAIARLLQLGLFQLLSQDINTRLQAMNLLFALFDRIFAYIVNVVTSPFAFFVMNHNCEDN
jgi:heme/copper-type cytochrome/quinol oxidase subunit 4